MLRTMSDQPCLRPLVVDYDVDPGRRRAIVSASQNYLTTQDVYPLVAERFARERPATVLDVGAGEGILGRELKSVGLPWVLLDNSPSMLRSLPDDAFNADATALPFPDESFDAVAALYMLYHLDRPQDAIEECRRVLNKGGLFTAAAAGADDAPELTPIFRATGLRVRHTFDSDIGPESIEAIFGNVEVESWDGPYIFLPDARALREYCRGYGLSSEDASSAPDLINTPLHITKRGAIMYARKS